MAEVTLTIGGRHYDVHCGDGEERHLLRLAGMIDAKMTQARKSVPGLTEIRQLLFASILLADEIHDLRAQGHDGQHMLDLPSAGQSVPERTAAEKPGKDADDMRTAAAQIDALAARIETLADLLAGEGPAS